MNIETFSQVYWYIWVLVILFMVILLLINGGGFLYFRKKRNQFLNQSNRIDRKPTIPIINPRSKQISIPSLLTSYTVTSDYQLSVMNKSEQLITSTPNPITDCKENIQSKTSFNQSDKITEKDFQQQALTEHHLIRDRYNKSPLKLTESLNISAQYWTDQCANTNVIVPSRLECRLDCKGQTLGENILSTKITNQFNGIQFTRMIIAYGEQSKERDCLLNEISTEVGFGFAQSKVQDYIQQQWIGVAYDYPSRQLTPIQS